MPAESTKAPADAGVFSSEGDVSTQWHCWWQQARALLYDQLQLITLEGERVARSMVALLVSALLVGLLVLTLWFMLLAQIVLFAQQYGVSLAQALALATIANLLGVWLLLRRCRHYSRLLRFPATMRSLRPLTADDKVG
ncbi:hypothetical protein [Rheinheimera fenheensis]|uniref:hypothetical protein n=1 Tax=Rheinheimera fenheensis TaxID=3152295 RepID=UPI003260BCF7